MSFTCKRIEPSVRNRLDKEDGFYAFIINEGSHVSFTALEKLYQSKITFEVKFDSTAIYTLHDNINQGDINKLYGFTDCGTTVHENSARFGWRYYNDSLQLFSYCYANGKRSWQFLKDIEIDSVFTCQIMTHEDEYIFKINDKILAREQRACTSNDTKRMYLYPYFGGDSVAPHQIKILIKDL